MDEARFKHTLNRPTYRRGELRNSSSFIIVPIEAFKTAGVPVTEGRLRVPPANVFA